MRVRQSIGFCCIKNDTIVFDSFFMKQNAANQVKTRYEAALLCVFTAAGFVEYVEDLPAFLRQKGIV